MAKTVNVEIATSDGLARYEISNGDLSKVPEQHRDRVASAIGAQPDPDPEPAPAGDEPDTTTAPTTAPKRVKE